MVGIDLADLGFWDAGLALIDEQLSAKFQASALNFNAVVKKLFGKKYSLDAEQAFSIQFAGIAEDTAKELMAQAATGRLAARARLRSRLPELRPRRVSLFSRFGR